MPNYLYRNILGIFIIDAGDTLMDQKLNPEDTADAQEILAKKYNAVPYPFPRVPAFLKDQKYYPFFRSRNLEIAKAKIRDSVGNDQLISQAVNSADEAEKIINSLSKRLREWYGLHAPEFTAGISHNQRFAELIVARKEKDESQDEKRNSMGASLPAGDIEMVQCLAKEVLSLYAFKENVQHYLEKKLEEHAPNLKAVAGTMLSAKLIEYAGSLKRLVMMPSSTIQVMGAEKALFRHMRTGAKSPRHGIIIDHPLISNAKDKEHGKRARAVAGAISLAVKVDFFKGAFVGKRLRDDLEVRFP